MPTIYSVTQINTYVKNMFTQDRTLSRVSVKGEVSNVTYQQSSGHIYFKIKDAGGVLSCVMFKFQRGGLNFQLEAGMQVVVEGNVNIFERDGVYQLYAKHITREGIGTLHEQFEALKRRLEEMGMFDPSYKKPIPKIIKTLGVVTAPTGAAVQDIINISKRRNPYVQIILYPAIVQGDLAPESIIKGIKALEQLQVDVMIVGRGGGSMEDLWAFNDERVAHAIFDCSVPIISAVGHETDFTIADFVADLRVPTPSAGAERAVYEVHLLQEQINRYEERLSTSLQRKCKDARRLVENYQKRLGYLSPVHQLKSKRNLMSSYEERLKNRMSQILMKKKHRLQMQIEKLKGLSPLDKLNQGFSFTTDMEGHTLSDVSTVSIGTHIQTYVKNGVIESEVIATNSKDYE